MKDNSLVEEQIMNNRLFMKSNFDEEFESDQNKKLPQPPLTKEAKGEQIISLDKDFSYVIK